MLKTLCMRLRRKFCHLLGDIQGVYRWTNLIYQKRVLPILRQSFDSSVPPAVNLEINTECNYSCPFCPQSTQKRPIHNVTMEDFMCVVSELKKVDFSHLFVLSVNNEPFLHPLLLDFCRIISEELPRASTVLISNGSLIKTPHLEFFANLDHPPRITVNDYTPSGNVKKRLSGLLSESEFSKLPIELCDRSWDEKKTSRAGNHPSERDPKYYSDITCTWPFSGIFFTPQLKAFLCCADYHCTTIYGDLHENSLMEIWQSPFLEEVRKSLLIPDRSKLSLCASCDAERFNLPMNDDMESFA